MSVTLRGLPLVEMLPSRIASMEMASGELFEALQRVTVADLKVMFPRERYTTLRDALVLVRELMGDGKDKEYVR